MIQVSVDSIRVSLINQERLVVLRENDSPRFLPIWIGPYEADAIQMGLQRTDAGRPLTHDLLRSVIGQLGGRLAHVQVSELRDQTFYAVLAVDVDGRRIEIDARPSDAIALAVRLEVPIFVADEVMASAGQVAAAEGEEEEAPEGEEGPSADPGQRDDSLDVFRDFFESLDLDEPPKGKKDK
jgi:bifunctional DNase/RNase